MTKTFTFDPENTRDLMRFARLYEALTHGASMPNQERAFEVYRREAKLLDKLEAISEPALVGLKQEPIGRALVANGHPLTVQVDGGELELLKKRLRLKDFWMATAVRSVVDTHDWLDAQPDRRRVGMVVGGKDLERARGASWPLDIDRRGLAERDLEAEVVGEYGPDDLLLDLAVERHVYLLPLVVMIEVLSFLSRPISLSVRLFANMLAGHITLKVFGAFVIMLGSIGVAGWVGAVLPLVMVVTLSALELLVAFLQAYVFAILTCIYLNDAIHPGH